MKWTHNVCVGLCLPFNATSTIYNPIMRVIVMCRNTTTHTAKDIRNATMYTAIERGGNNYDCYKVKCWQGREMYALRTMHLNRKHTSKHSYKFAIESQHNHPPTDYELWFNCFTDIVFGLAYMYVHFFRWNGHPSVKICYKYKILN